MSSAGVLVVVSLSVFQVPSPAADGSRELEAARRALVARQSSGSKDRAPADGATRFVPLADIVAAAPAASPAKAELAARWFDLAQRAAKADPPRYGLAGRCLRAVLELQPDHREARRLMGFVPHDGGWATPFAVGQLRKGLVDHPTFGWVSTDWVPHLDKGELPAPSASRGQKRTRWLSAEQADRLRADWNPPWQIYTEHFEVQTNVTLAETIQFGRRLEAFHDLFTSVMADVLVEKLPLVRRFKEPGLTGDPPSKPHVVYYFGTRDEYNNHLRPRFGQKISASLGFYDPPKPGRGNRSPAYFFRDPDGQIPMMATLYHEVSHQLLFETAGPNNYNKNVGNYWVFEGLGTYFETVSPQPDGSIEVGGFVGVRMQEAAKSMIGRGRMIPLEEFVAYGEDAFMNDDPGIYVRYQEAMALAVFLMQWHDGTYRDAFLDYVRDAYRGRIKGSARTLEDRLGQPYATLDAQFLAFVKAGGTDVKEPGPVVVRPDLESKPVNAIRTVPRR